MNTVEMLGCYGKSNQEQSCKGCCSCNWCDVSSFEVRKRYHSVCWILEAICYDLSDWTGPLHCYLVNLVQKLFHQKEYWRCFPNFLIIKTRMFELRQRDWPWSFVDGLGRILLNQFYSRRCEIRWYCYLIWTPFCEFLIWFFVLDVSLSWNILTFAGLFLEEKRVGGWVGQCYRDCKAITKNKVHIILDKCLFYEIFIFSSQLMVEYLVLACVKLYNFLLSKWSFFKNIYCCKNDMVELGGKEHIS